MKFSQYFKTKRETDPHIEKCYLAVVMGVPDPAQGRYAYFFHLKKPPLKGGIVGRPFSYERETKGIADMPLLSGAFHYFK